MAIKIPFITSRPKGGQTGLSMTQIEALRREGFSTIGPAPEGTDLGPSLQEEFKDPVKRQEEIFRLKDRVDPFGARKPITIPFTKGGRLPFGLKDPTTGSEFLTTPKSSIFIPLAAGLTEGTLEAIPGLFKAIGQVPKIARTGKLPRPSIETRVESPLDIGGAISDLAQEQGVDPQKAELLGGTVGLGIGILDAWFTRSVGRGFTQATLRNIAVPDEIHQMAWQKLGRAQSQKEALKIADDLLREVSPNSSNAVRQGTVDEIISREVTDARNIIKAKGIPTTPPLPARTLRNFARILDADVEDLARVGLGPEVQAGFAKPAGLLPGGRPAGGKPGIRFGLSIEEVESVGGEAVKREIASKASKAASTEVFESTLTGAEKLVIKQAGATPRAIYNEIKGVIEAPAPTKTSGISKELQPLAEEARKYKSAEKFFLSGRENIDRLRESGIKGEQQIKRFWEEATRGMDKTPVIDTLNPTGGVLVDYTPEVRASARLGENITTLSETMGQSPDDTITIYRGAPKNQKDIQAGDFVTTNRELAQSYTGTGNVLEKEVRLGDVLDDTTEPLGEEYIYRPNADKELQVAVGTADETISPKLTQEAQKYDSVEDFIEAQGPERTLFHATDQEFEKFRVSEDGVFFHRDRSVVESEDFPIVKERFLKPEAKLISEEDLSKLENTNEFLDDESPLGEALKTRGFDGIDQGDVVILFNPDQDTLSRSQLTDIFNRVNGEDAGPIATIEDANRRMQELANIDKENIDILFTEIDKVASQKLGISDIEPLTQRMDELKQELEFIQATIDDNPAVALDKYVAPSVRKGIAELPEITGGTQKELLARGVRGKNQQRFAQMGDDIIDELGFADERAAQDAVDRLYADRQRKVEIRDELREIRNDFRSAKANSKEALDLIKRIKQNRKSLTPAQTKRAIRESTRPDTSPLVQRRESTLLKDKIRNIAKGARVGSISTRKDILKAGKELKATLKEAGVSSEDAKWFIDAFKNLRGMEDLAAKLPEITARADRLANAREVRTLKSDINKELKSTKPKIGQKKALEGKFTPEVQKQLDFLRGETSDPELKALLNRTARTTKGGNKVSGVNGNRMKALDEIEKNINKFGAAEDGVPVAMPEEAARQNALLNMIGIQDMSVEELKSVLANIKSLKDEGQLASLVRQFNKASELDQVKEVAKAEFKPTKGKPKVLGEAERQINPVERAWHAIDNAVLGIRNIVEKATFSKDFKVTDWVWDKVRTARNAHNRLGPEWNNAKVKAFKEIFGEEKLGKIYRDLNKEKQVFSGKDASGNKVEISLTQLEAAYWHGLAQDPTNVQLFVKNMGFTPEMFKALDKFVDPKVKQYVKFLQDDWLKTVRERVNTRYMEKFGIEMPNNPNYMPRLYSDKTAQEEITNLLVGEAFPGHPSTVPSGVKARIGSKAEFRKISIENVIRRHGEQMNQFVNFDEAVSDLRRVFSDPEVKEIILSQKGGKQLYETLIKKIDDIARGGMAAQMKLVAIDKLIGSFTKASLMFNWVPFAKQLTSLPAFTLGRGSVSYRQLISGSASYYRHPVEWTKRLAKSDFIFGRLTKGFDRETALAFRAGNSAYTIKEVEMSLEEFLKKAAMTPTRGGDMVPILPGMVAKYKQVFKELRDKGVPVKEAEAKALAAAEDIASRTQQSPHIEDLARIQTANSLGKAISMYATTPIQFHREAVGVIRAWSRGQASFKDMMRGVITAWIVLPQIFQWVSDGFEWNNERQLRALLLGPWNYYPAAGNLMGTMYDAFSKGETWKTMAAGISPLFSIPEDARGVATALGKIMFRDGDADDWRKFAEKLYSVIALSTGKLPSTAPRTIEGIEDLISGDTDDIRRLFFSEYALDPGDEEAGSVGDVDFGLGGIDFGFEQMDFDLDIPSIDNLQSSAPSPDSGGIARGNEPGLLASIMSNIVPTASAAEVQGVAQEAEKRGGSVVSWIVNGFKNFVETIMDKTGRRVVFEKEMESQPLQAIEGRGPDKVDITKNDIEELRAIIFSEISNRNPERQEFEAEIVANTAINRAAQGDATLQGILTQPGQYQGYQTDEYKKGKSEGLDEPSRQKMEVVDRVLEGILSGQLDDTTDGAFAYVHDEQGRIWLKPTSRPRVVNGKFFFD